VIELKTNEPTRGPSRRCRSLFERDVRRINRILERHGARLMPTAMHPWMDPMREAKLWAHEYSAVYAAFDRIFDCRGHGWANLQSTHLNLPFFGDEEFGRLHAAIRLVLPLLPALAAASPLVEGRATGLLDNRLDAYRTNARRVPSVSGRVIPERVFTHERYQKELLERIYGDLAPHDPDGILREEWVNARGAIARFDRHTIEIRVLDVQECPQADLAIAGLIVKTLTALVAGRYGTPEELMAWEIDPLEAILLATIRDADAAVIEDARYLEMFGMTSRRGGATAGDVWRHLSESLVLTGETADDHLFDPLRTILEKGPLARRILRAAGGSPDRGG
jgi:glutamate---cysteine ligase / carboxylate-amine ligase